MERREMKQIRLSKNFTSIIDDDDYESVSILEWCASITKTGHVYGVTAHGRGQISMHRFILGLTKDSIGVVDHIDGDTLNNQRSNLRVCSQAENIWNSKKKRDCASRYKGVQKFNQGWQVRIQKNGTSVYFGAFKHQVAAAVTYNRHAKDMFGEFAKLNDIANESEILSIVDEISEMKAKIRSLEERLAAFDVDQDIPECSR